MKEGNVWNCCKESENERLCCYSGLPPLHFSYFLSIHIHCSYRVSPNTCPLCNPCRLLPNHFLQPLNLCVSLPPPPALFSSPIFEHSRVAWYPTWTQVGLHQALALMLSQQGYQNQSAACHSFCQINIKGQEGEYLFNNTFLLLF